MKPGATLHPTAIIIFGGTGDLARSKLFPALLDLYIAQELPERFTIIGLSRKDFTDTAYQSYVRESIAATQREYEEADVAEFSRHIRYVQGAFDDAASYERIKDRLLEYDESIAACANKLFYLAVPPQYYETIFAELHRSNALGLCDGVTSWARLLVEKPFGRDLATAQVLEHTLTSLFNDEQIYRIDHYLAKDAIENLVALRFVNTVLADSWDARAVESVHIKLFETKDVSNRGSFYDAIGTLLDVGQNHMLQIFALLTMPLADVHDAQAIRAARASALRALKDHTKTTLVRAQYEGYRATTGVAPESETETYFKIGFFLNSGVWQGTAFTLEAGKALHEQVNEAIITFRPRNLCHCAAESTPHEHRNVLTLTFAPAQHMSLSVWTKRPGFAFALRESTLTLVAGPAEPSASPEAYERVLYDCIAGDQTRFVSGEEVELAWQFITPILEHFRELPLATYEPGSTGPDTSTQAPTLNTLTTSPHA